MSNGKIRHMFPGGNTSEGFYSYYDYILPQDEATRIFIIKGGPGVGKSTFMKQSGQDLLKEGYDVEFMHCSSDPESLDGLVIPALKVALIDGTAPHIVDPKNPGAVDEIIHLGDFWDEDGMKSNREDIMKANNEVGRLFARAYRYLKAASYVYEDNIKIYELASNRQQANIIAYRIIEDIFGDEKAAENEGGTRCLFASAITPSGLKNYLPSILNTNRLIVLKGHKGTGREVLLEKIVEAAVIRGYYVECYYCPMTPEKLEHIVIPGKDISIATSSRYHVVLTEDRENYNLDDYLDAAVIKYYKDIAEYNKLEFEGLLNRAILTIQKAKKVHDEMEQYYIHNMDFNALQKCRRETVKKILKPYCRN